MDPAAVAEELASDPEALFVQLLEEKKQALKPSDIPAALLRVGLDEQAVAAAWKLVRSKLAKNPHIRVSGKPSTYQWTATARDPEPPSVSQKPVRTPAPKTRAVPRTPKIVGEEQKPIRTDPDTSPVGLAEHLLAAAAGTRPWPPPSQIAHEIRTPLAAGLRLAELPERALDQLADEAFAQKRRDLWWLLALTGRPTKGIEGLVGRLASDRNAVAISGDLLANLRAELLGNISATESEIDTAELILARIGPFAAKSTKAIIPLLALTNTFPKSGPIGRKLISATLAAIQSADERVLQEAMAESDALAVLIAASAVPLVPSGSRARLIAAAQRSGENPVSEPAVWENADANDVARLVQTGELRAVLRHPRVAEIVNTMVKRTTEVTETTQQLAKVLILASRALRASAAAAARRRAYPSPSQRCTSQAGSRSGD